MSDRRAHKHAVRRAFDRAADSYDGAAAVQRQACDRLADFAARLASAPAARIALDAGCGTGYGLAALAALCPATTTVALDFAPAMLRRALHGAAALPQRPLALCADLEALPLAPGCVDAIWSSLAMQWCEPAQVLGECAAALGSGGVAWIATLGPDTLWELRTAFAGVDEAAHVLDFHDAACWRAAALQVGLECVACETEALPALAPDLRRLLRDIKAIGAHTVGGERRKAPLGRSAWQRLEAAYEVHRRSDGLLPATYDLILLALRKP